MKFAADEMLGKLARWLRMAGLDVSYSRQIEDQKLVERSRAEGRMLLTRDTRLVKSLGSEEYFFVTENRLEDQLREFLGRFPSLKNELQPFSRCVECNTPLAAVEKECIRQKVYPYVFSTQEKFTSCPSCQRIYWQATHVAKIREKLSRLFGLNA